MLTELGAAIVVACVGIPMGMGIASISGAPPVAGIIAGIVGGLVVGSLSGSPTSITGPSAGLTLMIASLMGTLNSYETFLGRHHCRATADRFSELPDWAGLRASSRPASWTHCWQRSASILSSSKFLTCWDTTRILKVTWPSFSRIAAPRSRNYSLFDGDVHVGAATVGLFTLALIFGVQLWSRSKRVQLPAMLIGAIGGTLGSVLVRQLGQDWFIDGRHLISLPVWESESGWGSMFRFD